MGERFVYGSGFVVKSLDDVGNEGLYYGIILGRRAFSGLDIFGFGLKWALFRLSVESPISSSQSDPAAARSASTVA